MDVFEAIKTRRSVRQYKHDPVMDKDLDELLEAVRWAPSWANTQCCRLIIVRDGDTKAKLADALKGVKQGGQNAADEAVRNAPVVIVACAEAGKSGFYRGEPMTDKSDWYMFDVALAMQNLALAAHALGLGTVHIGLFDAPKVAEILNVPDGIVVVEMTPLGYPDGEAKAPPRKELAETVSYETYGRTSA